MYFTPRSTGERVEYCHVSYTEPCENATEVVGDQCSCLCQCETDNNVTRGFKMRLAPESLEGGSFTCGVDCFDSDGASLQTRLDSEGCDIEAFGKFIVVD